MLLDEEITVDPVTFAVQRAEEGRPVSGIPASPLMHSTGFVVATLPALAAGGSVTTLESHSFDAHELFRTIEDVRGEIIAIVGDAFAIPMIKALDEGHADGTPYDTSSVLAIGSAGVAWSAHNKARLLEHMPEAALHDSCGASEGCAYGVNLIRAGDELTTATFQATPGLIVLSDDGTELPVGEIGLMAGPATATGYFRDPEKSAQTYFQREGVWYAKPGDLGQIHADGTVTLIGRGASTINTGGEKVFPAEVEQAISSLDDVEDCVVVGVPDERFGQAVAALGEAGSRCRRSMPTTSLPSCARCSPATRFLGACASSTRCHGCPTARSTTRPRVSWPRTRSWCRDPDNRPDEPAATARSRNR